MQDNYRNFSRKKKPRTAHFLNEDIRTPNVRLVTPDGSIETSLENAIKDAKSQGLNVVQIARNENISIVKIVDYGKFKFEEAKKKKEHKKSQKTVQLKEVKLGPKIDVEDFTRKYRDAKTFLEKGYNVRVSMRFRGREMAHANLGKVKMLDFFDSIKEITIMEREPTLQGKQMSMLLRPKNKKEGGHKPIKVTKVSKITSVDKNIVQKKIE